MANWSFSRIKEEPAYMKWRAGVRQVIDYDCKDTLELETKMFDFGHCMGVAAAMSILTENVAEFKKPHDWIEAFKERWFPTTLLKRWPVRYDLINVKALYPNITLKNQPVIFKASPSHFERSEIEH